MNLCFPLSENTETVSEVKAMFIYGLLMPLSVAQTVRRRMIDRIINEQ
jgi:hypothetical protein